MVIFKFYKIIDLGRLSVDANTIGWKVLGEEDIHIPLTFYPTKTFMIVKVENVLLQRRDLVVTTLLSDPNIASLIVTNLNNVPDVLNTVPRILHTWVFLSILSLPPSNYIQIFRLGVEY